MGADEPGDLYVAPVSHGVEGGMDRSLGFVEQRNLLLGFHAIEVDEGFVFG